ncbi:hypothetical protein GPX89_10090 [Nocardia sp. ET3-3]|uniref:Uncharacterized protein n=1 Tax=Nocardia terrae TaxID=2675851 RepID=A0A7K1UUN8_9NOCA|nr:hypothetical protein [Nocardia terrae]MVU77588.1 hypothetical protein [Nocardia terrae]
MSSLEQRFAEFIAQLRGLDADTAAERGAALRTRLEALEFELRLTPASDARLDALAARHREAADLLAALPTSADDSKSPAGQPFSRGTSRSVESRPGGEASMSSIEEV